MEVKILKKKKKKIKNKINIKEMDRKISGKKEKKKKNIILKKKK